MESSERETLIYVNRADMDARYFHFWTSEAADFRRLCRRIGGERNLLRFEVGSANGKPRSRDCRVPFEFLNPATFAIGVRRRKKVSPEQRAALGDRLKRARKLKNSQTVCEAAR